jgi:hypothetical protein
MAKATIVGPHIGAKRIVVRNQKPGQAEIQVQKYYNQVLDKLGPSLDSILRNEKELPSSNEELYQGVRNVCMQGKSTTLYAELSRRMESYAMMTLKSRIRNGLLSTPVETQALPSILQEWALWKSQWVRRQLLET